MSSSIPIPQLTGSTKKGPSSNSPHNVIETGRNKSAPSAPIQRSIPKRKAPPRPPPPVRVSAQNENASKGSAITSNGQIRRCAIGRLASFGQLYDARTDKFRGASIFSNAFLQPTSRPIHSQEIHKLEGNSIANTLSKLDMELEQQLSIMTSLSPLDPEANWGRLTTTKKFDRDVMSSLIYKLHTTDEMVDIFQVNFGSAIDVDNSQGEEATHVVVGIQFGAFAILSLHYKNQGNQEVTEIESLLSQQMDKLSTAINDNSPVSFREFDRAHDRDVTVRCFGDTFQSDKDGRTLDRASQILKEVPSQIASTSGGKGVPIMYFLHPILGFRDQFKLVLQKSISFTPVAPAILEEVICELDQIMMAKGKLNELNQVVSEHKFCVDAEIIRDVSNLQRHMSEVKVKLIQAIASLLPQVRSGNEGQGEISEILQQFHSSNVSPGHVLQQLRKYDPLLAKIRLADAFIHEGAQYIGIGSSLEDEIRKYPESKIVLLFFNQHSEALDHNKWKGDRDLFLGEIRKKEDGCKYFVVDCDIHPGSLPTSMSSLVQVVHAGSSEFEDLSPDQYLESPEDSTVPLANAEGETVPTPEPPVPSNELNILILGETGVGKSTWINSFKNYTTFDSLEAAEQGSLGTIIPSKFTVYNEDFEQITVSTGSDPNEGEQPGESATQQARVHPFHIDDTLVRLIDTPGIGDTRGIDQDKLNFQNILTTLSYLEQIHGICIFLKPNNSRLNLMFRFCVKELLKYLHRDASKNILFCFTNSRGTLYRPGDTYPALMTLLGENREVDIPVNRETVFCFDSEPYRYLAAVKNSIPVKFSEEERLNFSNSWDNSVAETHRMVAHIRGLPPHPIQSTLNLNYVRELILKMVRPLAEITRNVQTNRTIMEQEKLEIQGTKENIKDLEKKRMTKRTEIKVSPLSHPRMVCANQKCVRVWSVGDVKTTQYDRICHDKCKLFLVKQDSIGSPLLRLCSKLRTGHCAHKDCGHGYKEHLRIYYESRQEVLEGENQAVVESLNNNLSAGEMKQKMIEEKNALIMEYENELKEIEIATTSFAYFLKINAITQFSDEMEVYLEQLMREERYKVDAGGNRKTLTLLEQGLSSYRNRKAALEKEVQAGRKPAPTTEEVNRLVRSLQKLKHSGKSLKEALACVTTNNKLESASFGKTFPSSGGK